MHAQRPEGPALSGQRPPVPARALPAQVKLANPVDPVSCADCGPAPITRLIHRRPPACLRWSTGFIDLVRSVLFGWAPASCGPLSWSGCWAQLAAARRAPRRRCLEAAASGPPGWDAARLASACRLVCVSWRAAWWSRSTAPSVPGQRSCPAAGDGLHRVAGCGLPAARVHEGDPQAGGPPQIAGRRGVRAVARPLRLGRVVHGGRTRSRALSLPGPGADRGGPGSVSMRAYSAAVAMLIAVPCSPAAAARVRPSACRASRSRSCRRRLVSRLASAIAFPSPPCKAAAFLTTAAAVRR